MLTTHLENSLDSLAPDKTVNPKKRLSPWINTQLKLLISERNATSRRYQRTGYRHLLNKFLALAAEVEEKSEVARSAYMQNRISNALDTNKNCWLEMRNLGLIPEVSDTLRGFSPEKLQVYFSNISFSPLKMQLLLIILYHQPLQMILNLKRLQLTMSYWLTLTSAFRLRVKMAFPTVSSPKHCQPLPNT